MISRDLELLLNACNHPDSKAYGIEAINCYSIGAYRSAIISIWISLTINFIGKIEELTNNGEQKPRDLFDQFKKIQEDLNRDPNNKGYIQGSQNFENSLIYEMHDLEIIDAHQRSDLLRLKEDRNKCAHPTYNIDGLVYQPTPEQTLTHLTNVIRHVLSQPPTQGRFARERILQLIRDDRFAIARADFDTGISYLEKSPLANAKKSLVREIIKVIFFDFTSRKLSVNKCLVTYEFIHRKYKDVLDETLGTLLQKYLATLQEELLSHGICILNYLPHLYSKIDSETESIIRNQISHREDWELNSIISETLNSPIFRENALERFNSMKYSDLKVLSTLSQNEPFIRKVILDKWLDALTYNNLESDHALKMFDDFIRDNVEIMEESDIKYVFSKYNEFKESKSLFEFLKGILYYKIISREEIIKNLNNWTIKITIPTENEVMHWIGPDWFSISRHEFRIEREKKKLSNQNDNPQVTSSQKTA